MEAFKNVCKIIVCGENMQSGGWNTNLPNTIDFELFESIGNKHYNRLNLDERSAMAPSHASG